MSRKSNVESTCKKCGNKFFVTAQMSKKGLTKFCSHECRHKQYPLLYTTKICKICGNEFSIRTSDLKHNHGMFCSRKCLNKSLAGEGNPFYNKKHSEETKMLLRKPKTEEHKQLLRKFRIGLKASNETKFKMSLSRMGKHPSDNTKLKLSLSKTGKNNPNFNKPMPLNVRLKISKTLTGKMIGDKNPNFGKVTPYNVRNKISLSTTGQKRTDITRKRLSLTKIGNLNPAYIHGESKRRYCYVFFGRDGVRIRSLIFYNYKCEECGKTNEESLLEYGSSLAVHHVYYRKMACCKNELSYESGILKIGKMLYIKERDGSIHEHEIIGKPEKFVVLCKSCHGKTVIKDRYKWIKHYEDIVNTKYDGKSFLTKEEYELFLKQ